MTPLDRIRRQKLEEHGWRTGTTLEDRAAWRLDRAGFTPPYITQQHRVGTYRLDFAVPSLQVAIEADGWHHGSPLSAAKDAERDRYLRSQGWLVFRVDDAETFDEQLVRVALVLHALREEDRRGYGYSAYKKVGAL